MNNFYKLKLIFNHTEKLKNIINEKSQDWRIKNGFEVLNLDLRIFLTDDTLRKIFLKFKFFPVIIKMNPMTFYRLHVDADRNAALNLLISGTDSITFYGVQTEREEISNITEVTYEDNKFFLLNTKQYHAVLNKNNYRYLLSLGFMDLNVKYEDILKFCIENDL